MLFNYFPHDPEGDGVTQVRTSRRIVFHGLGALGVAVALAGCGGGDDATTTADPTTDPTTDATTPSDPAPTDQTTEPTTEPTTDPEPTSPAGGGLVATSEVPVGGGVVLPDDNLVVVQPAEGEFRAYSATCTHTGTQVDEIDGTEIVCPNHGSRFSIDDGSAVVGPASAPLPEVRVVVADGQISLA